MQTPVASIEAIRIDCDSIIERHTVWSHEQPFAAIGDFFAADVSKGLRVFATWTEYEYSSTIIYFRLIHANNGSRSNVGIAAVENDEAAKANNEYRTYAKGALLCALTLILQRTGLAMRSLNSKCVSPNELRNQIAAVATLGRNDKPKGLIYRTYAVGTNR